MKKLTFLLSLLPLWAAIACSTPVQDPGGDDGSEWDVDPWTNAHYIYLNKCSKTITISFTGSEYHAFDSGTLTIKPNKRDTLTLTNIPGNWYQPFAYGNETVVTVSDGTRQFTQYGANEDKIFDWHYYDITYVSDAVRAFEYWIVEEFFPDDPEPAPDDEASLAVSVNTLKRRRIMILRRFVLKGCQRHPYGPISKATCCSPLASAL